MSSSLGEKLRTAREERGITLSEVAEQTRISPLYLEAIDSDNFKILPGGIFNKGFVRSYAKYVGVDEQEALREYSRLVAENDEADDEKLKSYRPEVLTDDRSLSSIIPTIAFATLILGIMTAGILFLVNYIQNYRNEAPIASSTANSNSASPAANTLDANVAVLPGSAPVMESLKVEFSAAGDEVWLRSVTDGKSSDLLIAPGKPVLFEPRESLNLRYSRSRAQFAQLTLNGKPIELPQQPESSSQSNIELSINSGNLAQIWDTGQIAYGTGVRPDSATPQPAAGTGGRPEPRSGTENPKPAADTNSNTASVPTMSNRTVPADRPTMSNRPSMTTRATNANRPRTVPTPIVVGRPPANGERPN